MSARGHEVTIVGPNDPDAQPSELPPRHISLPSIPLRNHPGLHLAMPSKSSLEAMKDANFDMVLAQSPSALLYAGSWLRQQHGVPLVCVNTVHMPSVYNVVLPDALNHVSSVNRLFEQKVMPWVESNTTDAYNAGDALVCLSPGLKRYWEERGVEVPIHVIPRAIEKRIFDQTGQDDPFSTEATPGARLLVVCRHAREKEVDRLLRIFAQYVYPRVVRKKSTASCGFSRSTCTLGSGARRSRSSATGPRARRSRSSPKSSASTIAPSSSASRGCSRCPLGSATPTSSSTRPFRRPTARSSARRFGAPSRLSRWTTAWALPAKSPMARTASWSIPRPKMPTVSSAVTSSCC
ncbi:MAG: glycosyltransferase [Deltaproteobacteria bacterium]|nr:glycosyltransferase [Deltaproteobacteria bacterium]